MVTPSVPSTLPPLPAPKKRRRGVPIAIRALINAKTLLGAGVFYALFVALVVGLLYPTMTKLNLDAYLTSTGVASLVGAKLTHASSFAAIIGLELYGAFYGLIFGSIIGYIAGAALPATIENGTLDLALARPISRTRYYSELWLSALFASVLTSLATMFAVWLSTLVVKNAQIDWTWLTITQLIEFAFFVFAVGVGLLFGSCMNSSRGAGGAAVGIIFLGYVMNALGSLTNKLNWLLKIEPYYYTPGVQALVQHNFTYWHPWVLVGVGLLCALCGMIIFNRRDLPMA
jgi:ABC-2 type transport system permease protein